MYLIEISNQQSDLQIDEQLLREAVQATLKAEEVAAARISIAIVDNQTIRQLNKRYLGHDWETDVLSFLLECEGPSGAGGGSDSSCPGRGKRLEGEVVISAEKALQRAPEFHWTAREELVLYLVHGLLHLVGYDDLTEKQRRAMRARERAVFERLSLTPGADR